MSNFFKLPFKYLILSGCLFAIACKAYYLFFAFISVLLLRYIYVYVPLTIFVWLISWFILVYCSRVITNDQYFDFFQLVNSYLFPSWLSCTYFGLIIHIININIINNQLRKISFLKNSLDFLAMCYSLNINLYCENLLTFINRFYIKQTNSVNDSVNSKPFKND